MPHQRKYSARWYRQRFEEIDRYLYHSDTAQVSIPLKRGNTTYWLVGFGSNGMAITKSETLRLTDEELRQCARYALDQLAILNQATGH